MLHIPYSSPHDIVKCIINYKTQSRQEICPLKKKKKGKKFAPSHIASEYEN